MIWAVIGSWLLLITFNPVFREAHLINEPAVYSNHTRLQMWNNGLIGANIDHIVQNPADTMQLIAHGVGGNYITKNFGQTWKLMQLEGWKYRGSNTARAPKIVWDNDGIMITAVNTKVYFSVDGKKWKSKDIEREIISIDYQETEKVVLIETIDHKKRAATEVVNTNGIDCFVKEYQRINAENTDTTKRKTNWVIYNHKVIHKPTPTQNIVKSNGINRPQLSAILQHAENPNRVVAVENYSIHEKKPQGDNHVWVSNDFGENWQQVTQAQAFLDTFKRASAHVRHEIYKSSTGEVFLNNTKIKINKPLAKRISYCGLVDEHTAYLLSDYGVQLTSIDKFGRPDKNYYWHWGSIQTGSKVKYRLDFDIALTDSSKIVFSKNEGHYQILIPATYGGVWFGRFPQQAPEKWLHNLANNGFAFFFVLVTVIGGLLWKKSINDKKRILTGIALAEAEKQTELQAALNMATTPETVVVQTENTAQPTAIAPSVEVLANSKTEIGKADKQLEKQKVQEILSEKPISKNEPIKKTTLTKSFIDKAALW